MRLTSGIQKALKRHRLLKPSAKAAPRSTPRATAQRGGPGRITTQDTFAAAQKASRGRRVLAGRDLGQLVRTALRGVKLPAGSKFLKYVRAASAGQPYALHAAV